MYGGRIFLGSDHGGLKLKAALLKFLDKKGYHVQDVGPFSLDPDDDYPDYAEKVCAKVIRHNGRGILICRSGAGVCIA
jgi:ribose 5-phosphate isomerase B